MAFFQSKEIRAAARTQSDIIDWKITCTTPTDYELTLKMQADAQLLKAVWDNAKVGILRKKGLDVRTQNPEDIQEFDAPESFHKYIKVMMRKTFSRCAKAVREDNVELLSYYVKRCNFKLNAAKGWDITLTFEGIYSKK